MNHTGSRSGTHTGTHQARLPLIDATANDEFDEDRFGPDRQPSTRPAWELDEHTRTAGLRGIAAVWARLRSAHGGTSAAARRGPVDRPGRPPGRAA